MGAEGKYRTIVCDPPWAGSVYARPGWRWRAGRPSGETRPLDYPTLSVGEIVSLPVSGLAGKDAHLYVWTTNAHLRAAYDVAEAWSFVPSCLLVWCKKPRGFGPGGTFQSNVEFILFCRRGSLPSCAKITSRWFQWPRSAHSSKPEAFLDLVEQVSPGPYLEMFARRNRLGWDTWGNECLEHVEIET